MQPGFIAAMKSECRMLSNSPLPGRATRLSNGALLVLSGIGRNHAAAGAEVLIKEGATAVISWGFAAGLARGVGPGTLILPERIISRDRETLLSDRLIYELIRNSLSDRIPHLRGALAESSRILKSSDEKKLLFQKTGALAADMESAAVAEAANIPVIASGGAGTLEHFYAGVVEGKASALLAASVFHFRTFTVRRVKEYLAERGVPVRL